MRNSILFILFLFILSSVYSQNVPDEIILSYQEEIELWINQNVTSIELQTINFKGIQLNIPYYINQYPQPRIFGKGGSIIDCNFIGRFLSLQECEQIYNELYSLIPDDAKSTFEPFKTLDNFCNSLVFNPSILFNSYELEINNYVRDHSSLFFYFGSSIEPLFDHVFNLQLEQLKHGENKQFLITPYSFYFAWFSITNNGVVELTGYYSSN